MADREKVIKGLECCMSEKICNSPCPYKGQCDNGGYYFSKAIEDAIGLLKAQEPMVITLEELSTLPIDTPVFIEEINDECGWNVFYGIDEEKDVCFCGFRASADYYDLEEYGMSWRCWTLRPTDEQRNEVKWNG